MITLTESGLINIFSIFMFLALNRTEPHVGVKIMTD